MRNEDNARAEGCGMIELMLHNPNADSFVREWQERALRAESALSALRERMEAVELPPLAPPYGDAREVALQEWGTCSRSPWFLLWSLEQRERQLKAALLANQELRGETARLKATGRDFYAMVRGESPQLLEDDINAIQFWDALEASMEPKEGTQGGAK